MKVLSGLILLILVGSHAPAVSLAADLRPSPIIRVQDRNILSGFVFDEARRPIARMYVELQSDFFSTLARVRTSESGMFTFNNLAPGQYYVKVLTSGTDFEEQTRSVTLTAVSGRAAHSEQIQFNLRSRKNKAAASLSSPATVFVQDTPPEARELYESALADLKDKREQAAFEKLKRSLEIFPDYYVALDRLGNEYLVRGHYEAAYVLFTKALMANPRSYSSTFGLGLTAFRLGQADLAVKHFASAVEIDRSLFNAHLWLGIALHSKKKNSEALQSLLKANDAAGGAAAEVHWQLARVYKDQNRLDKAADELELFLKYDPEAKNAAEVRQIIESLRKKN